MSIRRLILLLALALGTTATGLSHAVSAQATGSTPAATPPATSPSTSAPADMVFDPTTGRYMPVSEQLPWRNSFFIFDNSVSHTTFDNSTLSNTDYWVQTYSLRPRWNFTDTLSLRMRQDIYAELVASSTTSEHQPVVLDTQVDLVEASIVTVGGVLIGVGGRVQLPTSLLSRNANRLFSTGVSTSATKVFGKILEGLITQAGISYVHWWASGTTASGYAPASLCIDGGQLSRCTNFATTTAIRDTITASIFGGLNFTPELSVGLSFAWLWQRGAGLDDINLSAVGGGGVGGGGVNETLSDETTHWRNLTSSSLFVAYQLTSWLQASLGMNSLTSQLNPNGTVRNPVWNPDTQYSLTFSVTLDQLYTTINATELTE